MCGEKKATSTAASGLSSQMRSRKREKDTEKKQVFNMFRRYAEEDIDCRARKWDEPFRKR